MHFLAEHKYHMDEQPDCFDECRERICNFWISPLEYKIVEITKNDRAAAQTLGEIIAGEPLLGVRLLTVAKLISGLPQVLSTVAQCISILGFDQTKALTLGMALFSSGQVPSTERNAESEDASPALCQIWEHSIGCGAFAGRIATKIGTVSPHFAFVAGFLHDIGRLVLYHCSREQYVTSAAIAMEKNIPLTEAETLAFGLNHLDLGEVWSRRVKLPNPVSAVIRYHHEPACMLQDFIAADIRRVITVVRLADLAWEHQGIGSGGERGEGVEELWRALDLQPEQWNGELQAIKQEIESTREIFGFRREDSGKASYLQPPTIAVETGSSSELQKLASNGRRGQVIRFPTRNSYSPRSRGNPASERPMVLVVEDHGSLCEILSLYLIRHGYHVRSADSGQLALDVLSTENVDLVLLDLMLPRVDGFTVLRRVRETHDGRPYIIVVSAGASEKDRNRVLDLGANEYMPKPFHLMRLLERIQTVEKYLLR
jgi:CheY-like chemotaxis protein/HD-like signal output (HDOD) protein